MIKRFSHYFYNKIQRESLQIDLFISMQKGVLIHIIPKLTNGGAETVLAQLVKEFDKKGIHQIVVTTQGTDKDYHYNTVASLCEVVHASKSKGAVKAVFQKHPNAVLLAWMYEAIFKAHLWKISFQTQHKILWNIRRSNFEKNKWIQKAILYFYGFYARWRKINVIYCAYKAQKAHQSFFFPKKNAVVIQNRWAKEQQIDRAKHQTEIKHNILYVGRYNLAKGPDRLLRIAKNVLPQHPNYILNIAGSGWMDVNIPFPIKHQVKRLGNIKDLIPLYQNSDCLLLTSYTEGYPNVLVEAAVCGTPIISFAVGDAGSILSDYPLGKLAKSEEDFSQKLNHLLKKRTTQEARINAATKARKNFRFAVTVQAYEKFIFHDAS